MTTLYSQQSKNIQKTWFYMFIFLILFSGIGFIFSYLYKDIGIFYGVLVFTIIFNFISYFFSSNIALSMSGAKEIKNKNDFPELWNILENLCITTKTKMPKLYIIEDESPNAFATGRNENNSAIALTSGIVNLLNKSELEGVMAHELAHIKNKDILLSTVIVCFVACINLLAQILIRINFFKSSDDRENNSGAILGLIFSIAVAIIAPIAALIIQLSISRKREFLADATGALYTRYPEGLASALEKISNFHRPMKIQNDAISHLFFINPKALSGDKKIDSKDEKVSWIAKLFMTHPPTSERIKALLGR